MSRLAPNNSQDSSLSGSRQSPAIREGNTSRVCGAVWSVKVRCVHSVCVCEWMEVGCAKSAHCQVISEQQTIQGQTWRASRPAFAMRRALSSTPSITFSECRLASRLFHTRLAAPTTPSLDSDKRNRGSASLCQNERKGRY